jgi:hypothetical protein
MTYPPYLLVQRFSHLSLAFAKRPEGLEFNQFRFNHTRFALTTQRSDDFFLRGLWPRHATLPPSFRNSSQMAGISRVCTGSSNNPDTFRYAHFPPLMRRTISLRIAWAFQEPHTPSESGLTAVLALESSSEHSLSVVPKSAGLIATDGTV